MDRMTDSQNHRTRSGRILADSDIEALAVDVEESDYDDQALKNRRRGRPLMGSAAADVMPVRVDPELRAA